MVLADTVELVFTSTAGFTLCWTFCTLLGLDSPIITNHTSDCELAHWPYFDV